MAATAFNLKRWCVLIRQRQQQNDTPPQNQAPHRRHAPASPDQEPRHDTS
jgi:hypothetical protein